MQPDIAIDMTNFRDATCSFLNHMISAPDKDLPELLGAHLAADTDWEVAFPINRLQGPEAVLERLLLPLRRALTGIRRRDEIFIGAGNRLTGGGDWVASVTHYVGNFDAPIIGIQPSHSLTFLRSGEFYRIEGGRIAEARVTIDFLDLMRQANCFPLPHMLGSEMLFPGPATHDGVLPGQRERGEASLDLVEAMLADLIEFNPVNFTSRGQTGKDGYWHDDMLWFGPGGIGASYRWDGFRRHHREAFLTAFPDRQAGVSYCHIGDGDYAAVGALGSMTHSGDYLGVEATGRELALRVMDFYRCAGGKIMENWVLLDYLDLFDQMGVDLLARAGAGRT